MPRAFTAFTSALVLSLAAPLAVRAQQPPQPEPSGQVEKSLRPSKEPFLVQEAAPPVITLPQRPDTRSPEDAKVKFMVHSLLITGNKVFRSAELYRLLPGGSAKQTREMTLAELKDVAAKITNHYRENGYGLAFAYVPAQEVLAGVVELVVMEGKIDKVLVTGNSHYSSEFIMDHVAGLQKTAMTLDDLERGLLTLNDYPGLKVGATLRAGDQPGTTDLYLSAEDEIPVALTFDYDNFGSRNVGENRVGAGVRFNNLFNDGHSMGLRSVSGVDAAEGQLTFGRADYLVPFRSGSKLLLYGSLYDYKAKGPLEILEPAGSGEVYGLMLSHPFYRSHLFTLGVDLGIEVKNLQQELLGQVTAEDHLRIGVLGGNLEWTDGADGRWIVQGHVRQGLGEVAGGMEKNDPDSSRFGADGDFTRFDILIYRIQKIFDWLHLIGKAYGQYCNDPLVISEQISIGGQDSVRGHDPFEFMGDRGYTATAELRAKLPFLDGINDPFKEGRTIVDMFQLAVFVDTGEAVRQDAAFGERAEQVLSGWGVGFRFDYPKVLSIRFDVGLPLSDEMVGGNGAVKDDNDPVFYASVILNLN